MIHDLYLALGSNLGDKAENIRKALDKIDERIGSVYRVANIIETAPVGYTSDNMYLNTVCLVHTMHSPERVLEETQRIEREMGRSEKTTIASDGTPIYQDRIIDIDLLQYDQIELSTPELTLPHPRMDERPFIKQQISEISQDIH